MRIKHWSRVGRNLVLWIYCTHSPVCFGGASLLFKESNVSNYFTVLCTLCCSFTILRQGIHAARQTVKQPDHPARALPADDLNYLMQGQSNSSKGAFIFALPCLFTAFLGTWQVQRRHWKVDLLQARTSALQVTPQLFWLQASLQASMDPSLSLLC